jgi:hypothetical protein
MKASYLYVGSNDTTVYIADMNIGMSITNDAEAVVAKLLPKIKGKRIVYKDTEGSWDELVHNGREFIGFARSEAPEGLLY